MLNRLFVITLPLVALLGSWLLLRMVGNTDPDVTGNVAVVLLLLFLVTTSLIGLLSWWIVRRIWREERPGMALRHGIWAGAFLVALPLLRWSDALRLVVIGALLLIILGMESLFLLQHDQEKPAGKSAGK